MWDGRIVGRWAEEHHEILSQRDPVWSRFQVECATATAKIRWLALSEGSPTVLTPQEAPWRGVLESEVLGGEVLTARG